MLWTRPYEHANDAPALVELRSICAVADREHLGENPLSRGASAGALRIWGEHDHLLAYAFIPAQTWWLDFAIHPQAREGLIPGQLFAWAEQHLAAQSPPLIVHCQYPATALWRRALLEQHGFHRIWDDVHMMRSLADPLPSWRLPDGMTLRYGASFQDLDRYQALHRAIFDGHAMSMTSHTSSAYRPELDVIASTEEGAWVAFCFCNEKKTNVGSIDVMGVLPGYRQRGIGQAVLSAGLERLKDAQMRSVRLETSQTNEAALRLYRKMGFEPGAHWIGYAKEARKIDLPTM